MGGVDSVPQKSCAIIYNGAPYGDDEGIKFNQPRGVAMDHSGNIFVADFGNNCLRKINHGSNSATVLAKFNIVTPFGIAVDNNDDVIFADPASHKIYKLGADKKTTIIAGSTQGFRDGNRATGVQFNCPTCVAVDRYGNIFVADCDNHRIRKIDTTGVTTTIAGTSTSGLLNTDTSSNNPESSFSFPHGLALDNNGDLIIADSGNHVIRKIFLLTGLVITLAGDGSRGFVNGTKAKFNYPIGVAIDKIGNIFVSDYLNHVIRQISPSGVVSTVAGCGSAGFKDSLDPLQIKFNGPTSIVVDDTTSHVIIADSKNHIIWKIQLNDCNEVSLKNFSGLEVINMTPSILKSIERTNEIEIIKDIMETEETEKLEYISTISNWTKEEVYEYFKKIPSLTHCAEKFYSEHIMGQVLLELNENRLVELGFKLGERFLILKKIHHLQLVNSGKSENDPERKENRFGDGLTTLDDGFFLFYPKDYVPTRSIQQLLGEISVFGKYSIQKAAKKERVGNLTVEEIALVYLYTEESPFYKELNRVMRSGSAEEQEYYRDFIFYLDSILKRLPAYSGSVYRGIHCSVPYETGMVVTWRAFSSTTAKAKVALKFIKDTKKGTLFLIKSTSARIIMYFSVYPEEEEILFPPNCRFMVKEISQATRQLLQEMLRIDLEHLRIFDLEEISE